MAEAATGVVLVTAGPVGPELAAVIRRLGGYRAVEVGYAGHDGARGRLNLAAAAERVLASGARRVLFIPLLTDALDDRLQEVVEQQIEELLMAHPEAEFVPVPLPLETEKHAQLLVSALKEAERAPADEGAVPLSVLAPRQAGIVQRLCGCNESISRLAALGFVPGSLVEMVHNYGLGPLIVAVRGGRLALGREEARQVRVRATDRWRGGARPFRRWGRGHRRGRKCT